ncbi:MAG: bifunctional riboflavin kinase/FAD synthetase [Tissierellia bacterium]|nr:bifunctional riboflavin kinase/FAD synthetase [Tissierellia bacterium]
MKITNLNKDNIKKASIIGLGNFDGIHVGHIKLIQKVIEISEKYDYESSLILFKNHTDTLLAKDHFKSHLTSLEDKIEILKGFNLSNIYILDFDEEVRKMNPEEFIEKILLDRCEARGIVVGKDYRFGYGAQGDVSFLKSHELDRYRLYIIDDHRVNGIRVSSTEIKDLIIKGDIEYANKLLNRYYRIQGRVVGGDGRGRGLGFPTANLEMNFNYLIPADGVYFTITNISGEKYASLTSIGTNPTFNGDSMRIEVFIESFSQDIYEKEISVEFVEYFRPTINFNSAEELIDQINKDKNKMISIKDVYMK